MENATPLSAAANRPAALAETYGGHAINCSGVSWSAVMAGAFVTAALSLILLSLGTGLGLSAVSPWSNLSALSSKLSTVTIVWLISMQIISSAMGGYLAGRLRTKWVGVHTDEVYFRDTAHGFLAWAVAFVVTAAFLTSAATFMAGAATSAAGGLGSAAGTATDGREHDSNGYYIDTLFRSENAKPNATEGAVRGEGVRIFAQALKAGSVSEADKKHLAQLVATETKLNPEEAATRVSEVFAAVQQAADTGRKLLAHALLWVFLALLTGAFSASLAATIGGRQRDCAVKV